MKQALLGFLLCSVISTSLAFGSYIGNNTSVYYSYDPKQIKAFINMRAKQGYHVIELECQTISGSAANAGMLIVVMEK